MAFIIAAVLLAALTPKGVHLYRDARRPRTPLDDILKLAKMEQAGRGLFGSWRPRQLALRASGVPLNDILMPENWGKLLLPGLRKVWHTKLASREALMQAGKIFPTPEGSTRAYEELQGIGEVGSDGWNEFDKLGKVPYGGFEPNFLATIRHRRFAKGLLVDRELLDDNQYPQAGIPRSITQRVEKLADSAAVFREKAAADVFNQAFTDSGLNSAGFSVAGPDGVGLVSTAHPLSPTNTGTQSNEFTLALTGPNVSTVREAMLGWTDDKGDLVSINPDTLLVPVGLGDTARTIVNTEFVLGSANNDRNPNHNRFEVVEWKYLTDTNAWFMIDSTLKDEHLHWFDRVKPEWQSTEDFDTLQAKYRGYMRFSTGWSTWQWIAGSNV